jgi:hypothetical protein
VPFDRYRGELGPPKLPMIMALMCGRSLQQPFHLSLITVLIEKPGTFLIDELLDLLGDVELISLIIPQRIQVYTKVLAVIPFILKS